MYMEMFEKVFNLNEISFDKLFEEIMKLYEKNVNAENEKKSYFNSKGFKYQNGELVDGFEKECVNGKCVKDETFNKEHKALNEHKHPFEKNSETITNEKKGLGHASKLVNKLLDDREVLKSEILKRENKINELKDYIDGLNEKIRGLHIENESLSNVINNIKNCF